MKRLRSVWMALIVVAMFFALKASAQVSLYTVVDTALRNSTSVRMAQADVMRAAAALSETKDIYIPNFTLGTSPGYSYGFPIGQPSIFNVQSNSLLFTFSQPDYVRAARSGLRSAELNLKDTRDQVILDASLDYVQLDKNEQTLAALDQEREFVEKLVSIEQDRVEAGVESRVELTKAKLTQAQLELKRLHTIDDLEHLRQQLATLTGLPASTFITERKSIPGNPDFSSRGDLLSNLTEKNAGVQAADADAKSKMYLSFGDDRQNYLPQFAFGAEYSRYAKFNNYEDYYRRFQHNNFGIGVQITVPLFDFSRRAKARESAAVAAHAAAQADQVRDQAAEQVLQLQKSFSELAAQQRVAQLQSELAQEQLDAITTQLANGSGAAGAQPLTPKNEQEARIQERQRYEDVLDADFAVTRAGLSLLRSTGGIEDWAKSIPKP